MEPLRTRQGAPPAGKEDKNPDTAHVYPSAPPRFCEPPVPPDLAAAQGRHGGPRRPVHVHGLRQGCCARRLPDLGAPPVQLCREAGPRLILPRADRGVPRPPADWYPRRAEVLRSRHGPRVEPERGGELQDFPIESAE